MSMSIIAMLLSLAMMLTGAGSAGAPAEVSRTLTLSNVTLTYNDETVALDPSVRLGVSADGEKAVYDFAVDANGEALFPVQLIADAEGVTALFAGSKQAVKVPADALDALLAQAQEMLAGQVQSDPQSAQLMTFLKDEFIPAYMGVLEMAQDEARTTEVSAKAKALFDEMIDRGEGIEGTYEYDGKTYDATVYHYTLGTEQMFALADAVYTCDEALSAYYDALFKLYGMLPEESGLNGITSMSDLSAKTGIGMQLDIVESVNEAEQLDAMDGTLTVDVSKAVNLAAQTEEGGDVPEIEPIVMDLHAVQLGEMANSQLDMTYTIENQSISMSALSSITADTKALSVMMEMAEGDQEAGRMSIYAFNQPNGNDGATWSGMNFNLEVPQEGVNLSVMFNDNKEADGSDEARLDVAVYAGEEPVVSAYVDVKQAADGEGSFEGLLQGGSDGSAATFSVNGSKAADGTGAAHVTLDFTQNGDTASLGFDLAVIGDAIQDLSEGAEVTVIDDLSQEGLQALTGDQGFQGKAMQVVGSFMADSQKLMSNESVAKLAGLFTAAATEPAEPAEPVEDAEPAEPVEDAEPAEPVEDAEDIEDADLEIDLSDAEVDEDGDYVIDMSELIEDGDDDSFDLDFDEDVEDDGVLPYNEPTFTWLPENWELVDQNVDTAYDMVDLSYYDEATGESLSAMFYPNSDSAAHYALGADGALTPLDDRVVSIIDGGDGGWSISFDDENAYVNLFIYSETITMEDIGRIIAGLTF